MKHRERTPENNNVGEFSPLKENLRQYLLSKYSLQDGERSPIKLEDLGKFDAETRTKGLAAIENDDLNGLAEIQKDLDVWFNYIFAKDREEGRRAEKLRDELGGWIDSILAR